MCLCSHLISPLFSTIGYSAYLEYLIITIPNEPPVNLFYFWWVHITYLSYTFTALATFLVVRHFVQFNSTLVYCILLFYLLWFNELLDLLNANSNFFTLTTISSSVNLLLLNPLNKYHPAIFYLSVSYLLALGLHWLLVSHKGHFFIEGGLRYLFGKFFTATAANIVALFGGSWWALQEGTWGGWWNWDASETFGLIPVLLVLWTLHSIKTNNFIWSQSHLWFAAPVIIFLLYSILQLNFDLISHNFGTRFFFFFNSNFIFVLILTVSLFALLTLIIIRFRVLTTSRIVFNNVPAIKSNYFLNTYVKASLFLVLLLWVVYSFADAVSASGVWAFGLFCVFSSPTYLELNIFIFLSITLVFIVLSRLTTSRYPILLLQQSPVFLWFCVHLGSVDSLRVSLMHQILLLFTLLTVTTHSLALQLNICSVPYLMLSDQLTFSFLTPISYCCDSWAVEESTTQFDVFKWDINMWVRREATNTSTLEKFGLTSSSSVVSSIRFVLTPYVLNLFHIELLWLPTVFVSFLTLLYLYLSFRKNFI